MNESSPLVGAIQDAPEVRPDAPVPFPDGIYFDLPEAPYHRDPALGSTDMKNLARNPVAWWFNSDLNPRRQIKEDTKAMIFGRAVHAMVLEGRGRLDQLFGPVQHSGSTKAGKEERAALSQQGRAPLPYDDYERALIAGTYVTADPELAQAFQGGQSEVSVFWTRDGIRRKARIDYLKIRSMVDLKSTREQEEMDFDQWCRREIAKRRYYIQMAHYFEARDHMRELVERDRVFGLHDSTWLGRVVTHEDPHWVWVFYQSSGAPETYGVYSGRGSKLHDIGQSQILLAESNYRAYADRFGLGGTPWVNPRKLEIYDPDEQPAWVWGA